MGLGTFGLVPTCTVVRALAEHGPVAEVAGEGAELPGDERVGQHLAGEVEVDEGEVDGVLPLLPPQAADVAEDLVDVHPGRCYGDIVRYT